MFKAGCSGRKEASSDSCPPPEFDDCKREKVFSCQSRIVKEKHWKLWDRASRFSRLNLVSSSQGLKGPLSAVGL